MSDNLRRKIEFTLAGYLFTFLNVIVTLNGFTVVGFFFGMVSLLFFIKALLIRNQ